MSKAKIPLLLVVLMIIPLMLLSMGCGKDKEYQLSTSSVPNGAGSVSPSGGIFKGEVTLVATPAQYYRFSAWGGAVEGNSNPLTLKMNSNKQIVAQFSRITNNLNVQINPTDSGTVYPSSGTFDAGTQVTITATPAKGYRFDHWGEGITGTANPANLFIDGNKTITAYFIKQYTLNVSSDPSEGGSVTPGTGLVDAGTKIQFAAVPSFTYYLKNWVGTGSNNDVSPSMTINNDTSVTAIFERCEKGESKTSSGPVSNDERWSPVTSVPILLNQFDWIQGEIVFATPNNRSTPIRSYIQDPAGNILNEFGSSRQSNFSFMAQTTGNYNVVFQNNSIWWAGYTLTYTPWTKP